MAPKHLFSVDVEEHFQVSAFDAAVPRSAWDSHETRVVANTERILDLLSEAGAKGTFFVLGWVAQRHPELVRRIAALGHEIASHGWWHYRVCTITPDAFRAEIRESKTLLEQLSGAPVVGYRAPSFSIIPGTEWAFDVLLEEGYRYDSSVFPIRRPGYGHPNASRRPFQISRASGTLVELPMTTTQIGPFRIPAAGGGYLRQFPFSVIRAGFRQAERDEAPGMFYIHPWEVDPDQPRIPVGPITRLRHYRGLARTAPLIARLLAEFQFTSVADWMSEATPFAQADAR